ncbi:MAG TPA: FKBP-type peptidyl-prolyl cis-trans isomerase [Pseudomonas sp.]|nr:FKBP-type peptidyl-prolyl cis-trans isomerase [Thiopseudomonas sp.]HHX06732.1 FKBP-type peptidyl-prolyl cis-trans isomerase [Pseudomonas sp.]
MKFVILAVAIALIAFYFIKNAKDKKASLQNIEIGNSFLTANKANPGVVETASGLQYQIVKKGDGSVHPSAKSTVKVHYHGTLLDGTVFDSSVERNEPISFPLNRVIKGWTEGLQLMVAGDTFKFFIPSDLAYGNAATGKIKPGSVLIFEVDLLEVQ